MNIGILAQLKQNCITGINRVTIGTMSEMQLLDKSNSYSWIGRCDWLGLNLPVIDALFASNERINLNLPVDLYDLDIVHSHSRPFYFHSKCNCAKIITIHDMIPLMFPEWKNNQKAYYDGPIRKTVEEADIVIAVSESTKKDVVHCFGVNPEKVKVVYNGLFSDMSSGCTLQEVVELKGKRFILSVSAIGANKNQMGLIEAFVRYKEQHKEDDLKLVLTGPIRQYEVVRDYQKKYPKSSADIIFTGFVSDAELNWLYKNALAFAMVSFYEGFGLPILEALSVGTPVISSDTSSMPEVGGDACVYCNPYEVESIEAAIDKIVNKEDLRELLKKNAGKQAEKFSYKKAAKETLDIYSMFE